MEHPTQSEEVLKLVELIRIKAVELDKKLPNMNKAQLHYLLGLIVGLIE